MIVLKWTSSKYYDTLNLWSLVECRLFFVKNRDKSILNYFYFRRETILRGHELMRIWAWNPYKIKFSLRKTNHNITVAGVFRSGFIIVSYDCHLKSFPSIVNSNSLKYIDRREADSSEILINRRHRAWFHYVRGDRIIPNFIL